MNNTIHKSVDGKNVDLLRKTVIGTCKDCYYDKQASCDLMDSMNDKSIISSSKACIQHCFGKIYTFIFIKAF